MTPKEIYDFIRNNPHKSETAISLIIQYGTKRVVDNDKELLTRIYNLWEDGEDHKLHNLFNNLEIERR